MFIKEGKNNEIAEALEQLLQDRNSSNKKEIKENKLDYGRKDKHGQTAEEN